MFLERNTCEMSSSCGIPIDSPGSYIVLASGGRVHNHDYLLYVLPAQHTFYRPNTVHNVLGPVSMMLLTCFSTFIYTFFTTPNLFWPSRFSPACVYFKPSMNTFEWFSGPTICYFIHFINIKRPIMCHSTKS